MISRRKAMFHFLNATFFRSVQTVARRVCCGPMSQTPSVPPPTAALGILESFGFTPSMVALDVMEKSGQIEVLQIELNDMLGVCIKILGDVSSVEAAIRQGHAAAEQMQGRPVSHVISRPDPSSWKAIESAVEYNPLIQQNVVTSLRSPSSSNATINEKLNPMSQAGEPISALGFIETQGFTAVFEAIDTACKAANVEVVGKEKLGGGYVTVIVKGDVAAVKAAVESGRQKVEGLGKLIAAHVIPRPSASVLALLPK